MMRSLFLVRPLGCFTVVITLWVTLIKRNMECVVFIRLRLPWVFLLYHGYWFKLGFKGVVRLLSLGFMLAQLGCLR